MDLFYPGPCPIQIFGADVSINAVSLERQLYVSVDRLERWPKPSAEVVTAIACFLVERYFLAPSPVPLANLFNEENTLTSLSKNARVARFLYQLLALAGPHQPALYPPTSLGEACIAPRCDLP